MKIRWFISIFACAPVIAALLALQSCGGVGGSTINNGGQGTVTAEFLALLSSEQRAAKSITPEECATCHGGRGVDDPIYRHWKETVHYSKGVSCESCHGPGSAHKANPNKTNILTYPGITEPVVCAQCHGPIYDQYKFAKHSEIVQDPIESTVEDPTRGRSSRCIACHSGLFRAQVYEQGKDPNDMTDDEIRTIAEQTLTKIPHTADCVTCHNPHKKTGNLTKEGEEVQLRHQVSNQDTTNIGPGVNAAVFTKYDHICAQCHNGRGTDPADAALEARTSRPSMHDSNQMQMLMGFGAVEGGGIIKRNTTHSQAPGQCTKCHMPNSRHTWTVSFDTSCTPCHTANDAANRADTIKSDILNLLIALRTRMQAYAQAKFGDPLDWDYTSLITDEGGTPPDQAQVAIEVKRARHNYYFVIRSGDYGVHNAPYAKSIIEVANKNLDAIGVPGAPTRGTNREESLRVIESDRARARRADTMDAN
jgi:formate-dependent nitrite reductase cytochrome c552 subunit